MSSRTVLSALGLVALALVAWELRWVLLVLFGAVVIGVALDVPITLLRRLVPLNRPTALALVLVVVILLGTKVGDLLLPELVQQVQEFIRLVPTMLQQLGDSAAALQLSAPDAQQPSVAGLDWGAGGPGSAAAARACHWQCHGSLSAAVPVIGLAVPR
jgi:predicted PurR-regulated permease PerM